MNINFRLELLPVTHPFLYKTEDSKTPTLIKSEVTLCRKNPSYHLGSCLTVVYFSFSGKKKKIPLFFRNFVPF